MKGKWLDLPQKWKGALGKYQFACLILAVGVFLMLLPVGGRDGPETTGERSGSGEVFDLAEFEEKLEHTLSKIEGAGNTRVVLTLDSGSRTVVAQDLERESGGSNTTTVVTVGRGSGNQEVVPLQTVAPRFRGALVVCPGGGDAQTRLRLVQAVSALTGLGTDRISICEGNG